MTAKSNNERPDARNSAAQPSVIIVLLFLTLIGVGCGAGFGILILKTKAQVPSISAVTTSEKDSVLEPRATSRYPADAVEISLDPIVSNIGSNDKTKMRLEASIIVNKSGALSPLLKKEMAEDIVAFFRGVALDDISGSRGFQNLREDLDDLARVRGRGTVYGLLISGFVVE